MKLFYIRSKTEYAEIKNEKLEEHYKEIHRFLPSTEQEFYVDGFSLVADCAVSFKVDFLYGLYPNVNWRERLICPITHLNNRMRFAVMILDLLGNALKKDKIYLMEQITLLHNFLKQRYINLIGSEFVDPDLDSGAVTKNGILHQNATLLSFSDEEFKLVLSFDVFEHILKYRKALEECFRVLRKNGKIIFTVPFNVNAEETLIRAKLSKDGQIIHLCEPEYHGDPLSSKGILCFQTFGWDLLRILREVGFSDAYAIIGWSIGLGFFTPQIIFIAEK